MSTPTTEHERNVHNGRIGGKIAQSPEGLANRLVAKWPTLTASQKATISNALRPVLTGDDR
jgi:hypothetical protein